ncbi:MAG: suppressor of fused domain protein [Myxococcota bacterium]
MHPTLERTQIAPPPTKPEGARASGIRPRPRTGHAARALDAALEAVSGDPPVQLLRPGYEPFGTRVSVAYVPQPTGTLYVTYGLSRAVREADEGPRSELSILVPGAPTDWPARFLRGLSTELACFGREPEPGTHLRFGAPLPRCFATPEERANAPDSDIRTVLFAVDPQLCPSWDDPHLLVRRIVGLSEAELAGVELFSSEGFLAALMEIEPQLITRIDRGAKPVVAPFFEGEESSGIQDAPSELTFEGVDWVSNGEHLWICLPRGNAGRQLREQIRARLHAGRHLRVRGPGDDGRSIGFEAGPAISVRYRGPTVELRLPPQHKILGTLAEPAPSATVWHLVSKHGRWSFAP